ncbi:MAG: TonB family protein [Deltaproteobacteria bacterium]|nr:TonB family protein [Deltaproteobacteria bacterium]
MRLCSFILITLLAALKAYAAIEPQGPLPEVPKATEAQPTPVLTKAPELLTFIKAEYPPEFLASGKSGEVLLFIDINEEGLVDNVEIQSASEPAFGDAAMSAATNFVFSPAEVDGKPAAIRIEYRYTFVPELPKEKKPQAEKPAEPQPITFSGTVREAGLRKPIAGAVVEIDGKPVAETDAEGKFAVRGLLPGKYKVRALSRNHRPYETNAEITANERLELSLYLVRQSGDPFETVVRTHSPRKEVARVELQRKEVERVPGTFGDPVRVLENLPGLARVPGGLGGALLVRGTPPADTATFIDGVQVPLLYHFLGLTSVINPEFLETIDFYPGGFGAQYGRATAGIANVKSRSIICDDWHGVGEISAMQLKAYVCVPAGSWSLAVAGRRSFIDFFLQSIIDSTSSNEPGQGSYTVSPVFWDYQLKASRRQDNHAIDIFAFGSNDRLKLYQSGSAEDVNVNFGMHLAFHRLLLRDRWQIDEQTTLTTSLTPGIEYQNFIITSDTGADSNQKIYIYSLEFRVDFQHKLNEKLVLNAGIDHQFGQGKVDLEFPFTTDLRRYPSPVFDYTKNQSYTSDGYGYHQGYWIEGVAMPLAELKLTGGLRFDRYDYYHTQAFMLQPRLSTRYEVRKGTTLKAAYGMYEKLPGPEYLQPKFGNPNLKPEQSHHFIVGFEHEFTDLINIDVQTYYNLRRNLRSPTPLVKYDNGKAIPQIWDNAGSGRAYGLEILLRKLATADGTFYGWVSYTLSRSLERERDKPVTTASGTSTTYRDDDFATKEHLVFFDQTHILTIVGQWTLPWGFEAGFRFRLTSGNPYTPLNSGRANWDADANVYRLNTSTLKRLSQRMPTFTQLDIRIDKNFIFDLWKLSVFLEVINAYNTKNVESYLYDYRYRERAAFSFLPVVPLIGVRGEF